MRVLAEVRLALRSLLRRPAFTGMAVLILGLGMGANTAMFSVVDAVLLRSLPYGDVERLVVVFSDGTARGQSNRLGTTAGDFVDWRAQAPVFAGLTALRNESRRITSLETPVVPLTHAVSANHFDVLGARPALGRGFQTGEDEPGRDDVVILSHALWQTSFGGDPSLVGRTITLDERPHTVVGVMGRDFYTAHFFPVQPGLWVPTSIDRIREERTTRDLLVYGRLARGTSRAAAQSAMTMLTARLAQTYPATNDRWSARLVPMRDHAVGQFSRTGTILLVAVGLVLLIACANVTNLVLARSAERAREVALRTALGGGRRQILTQLMTESLLLCAMGGTVGVALAYLGAPALAQMIPAQAGVPFLDRVAIDGRVLAFTFAISLIAALLFGLAPLRQSTRLDLVEVLREGGRGTVASGGRRLREGLVVAEVATAVVIVWSAGLMLQTFAGLGRVHPGYDAEKILKLRTSSRGEHFRSPAARIAHFEELARRLAALPGVASVSAVDFEPPTVSGGGAAFAAVRIVLPGASDDAASAPSAVARAVLLGYFETMGIPVLKGRGVSADDAAGTRRIAVISQTMARRYFSDVDPIGRTFSVVGPRSQPMEIVGVVGDLITAGTDPTPQPMFYTPYAQNPLPVMSMVMRVPDGDPMSPAREAERIAWSLSPNTNVYAIETLDRRIADLNWRTRLGASLLGGFAALALLLGAAGVYAVVSYTTLQRRAEIGVRMALGARGSDVLAMVLKGGLRLALLGLVLGSLASLAFTRALAGFLYGVSPADPATFAAVSAVLLLAATAACLGPALRASRVDPLRALRE